MSVSKAAAHAIETMKNHPELLKLSPFVLECMNTCPDSPGSPTLSELSTVSSYLSSATFASDATIVSQYSPNKYERTYFYNGIAGDSDHPELVYRSDFLSTPFVNRHGHIPVKSLRGVFDTPLNGVWDTVRPQICDLVKAWKINWSSIDLARFFVHGPLDEKGSLGPVVIWVGVIPGSTSSDTAHEISQEILALLLKNEVEDVVVEWREAVSRRLAGPTLSVGFI